MLVIHNYAALKFFDIDQVEYLARLGYVGLAIDLYSEKISPEERRWSTDPERLQVHTRKSFTAIARQSSQVHSESQISQPDGSLKLEQDRFYDSNMASVFLEKPASEWVASNELAFAVRDGFPVSPGHTLIVTKRPVTTWFGASREEQLAILELIDEVRRLLDLEYHPDGYNVGFNAGVAAGQTVMHLHVHVIPRYLGDLPDPRGGVRHVIPTKAAYWD